MPIWSSLLMPIHVSYRRYTDLTIFLFVVVLTLYVSQHLVFLFSVSDSVVSLRVDFREIVSAFTTSFIWLYSKTCLTATQK